MPGQIYRVVFHVTGAPESLRVRPVVGSAAGARRHPLAAVRRHARPAERRAASACARPGAREQELVAAGATRLLASPLVERGRPRRRADARRRHRADHAVARRHLRAAVGAAEPVGAPHLGKRISDRLYLTYSRALSASSRDQIILLEYNQSDRFSWIVSQNEDRTYAVDVRVQARVLMRRAVRVAFVLVAGPGAGTRRRARRRSRPASIRCSAGTVSRASTVVADGRAARRSRRCAPLRRHAVGRAAGDGRRARARCGRWPRSSASTTSPCAPRPLGDGVALVYDVALTRRVDAHRVHAATAACRTAAAAGALSRTVRRPASRPRGAPARWPASSPRRCVRRASSTRASHGTSSPARRTTSPRWSSTSPPGRRHASARVTVDGEPAEGAARLQQRLGRSRRAAVARGRRARRGREREARRWREKGHYQAHIDLVPQRRREAKPVVDLRVDARPVRSSSSCSRATPCPSRGIADLVPVEREGAVDEDLLEDSKRRIERYLRSEGYLAGAGRRTGARRRTGQLTHRVRRAQRGRLFEVGDVDARRRASRPPRHASTRC